MPAFLPLKALLASTALMLSTAALAAQGELKLAGAFDTASAPTAASLPGLDGGFRQQILIGAPRLASIAQRKITALAFRRDLSRTGLMAGGSVQMELWLSACPHAPEKAVESFAGNTGAGRLLVFQGTMQVPDSPAISGNPDPWSSSNSVVLTFGVPFDYTGGTLCIDWIGRPTGSKQPRGWIADYEGAGGGGQAIPFGRSCSASVASVPSLIGEDWGLRIGSTLRMVGYGRPDAQPLLLIGARPVAGGLDLGAMGAVGCKQYVDYFAMAALAFQPPIQGFSFGFVNFFAQVPSDDALLGNSVFAQLAEIESTANRSNVAGLTTSNGLELRIGSAKPDLGMSVVVSHRVEDKTPMPNSGRVNVDTAPVLRVRWR
ncbi:MAG: hypothetical protein H6836_03300 [Planctomycetes bacterium]|nr:hypothetical protein [Planctomycetota bacterium]